MTKHTATMPVKATYREGQYCAYWEIVDAAGKRIAMTTETDAAYIVRCVNSHEALVEALKYTESLVCDSKDARTSKCLSMIDAALKLAGEEVSNG